MSKQVRRRKFRGTQARKNQPTSTQVNGNVPLNTIALSYMQSETLFFADQIFPIVPVNKQAGTFYEWDPADANRDAAQKVGPGAHYPIGVKSVSKNPYYCDVVKYAEIISDEEMANADNLLALDTAAVNSVMSRHKLRMDVEFKDKCFTTGVWDTDFTVSTKWDDAAGNWITDSRAQIRALANKGFLRSNMVALAAPAVYDVLIDSSVTLDRLQQLNMAKDTGKPDETDLAAILRIGKFIVGESVVNTAARGATASEGPVLGTDGILFAYVNPNPAINAPSAGYTFAWTELGGTGVDVDRLRRDELDGDMIKGRTAYDINPVAPRCAAFGADVLT